MGALMKLLHTLIAIGSFLAIIFFMYFVLDEYYFKHTQYPLIHYVLHGILIVCFYKLDSTIMKYSVTTSSEKSNDNQ